MIVSVASYSQLTRFETSRADTLCVTSKRACLLFRLFEADFEVLYENGFTV